MSIALLIVGGFLLVLGAIIFLVDAFKVHWGWGLASILLMPFANVVCLFKHWTETKKGFLLSLLAFPFLAGGFFLMPKTAAVGKKGEPQINNDPFYNAMQRARSAVAKVQETRRDLPGAPVLVPVPEMSTETASVAPLPASTPALTVAQRLANNRTAFKNLETQFADLNTRRKTLPKNDSQAIAAFNLAAKDYADQLAEVRSQQAVLLELQRTAAK